MRRIVLDTNYLIQVIPSQSQYRKVWDAYRKGELCLCVTTEILDEYFEILSRLANVRVAQNILNIIGNSRFTIFCTPFYKFNLIPTDYDDNKFVDCTIIGQAEYVVTNDRHFDILKEIPFPKVYVISLDDFVEKI